MRSLVLITAVVALTACPPPAPPNTFTLTNGTTTIDVTVEPFSFVVKGASGEVLRSRSETEGKYGRFAPTLDRPTYITGIIPGWDDYRPGDGDWVHGGKASIIERTDTSATIGWDLNADRVRITLNVENGKAKISAAVQNTEGGPPAVRFNKSSMAFALAADDHFFGLGERFATFDHRGWSMYSWAEEGALGGGEGVAPGPENPYPLGPSMTYFPVPFFLSPRGYGVHLDTDYRTELHLGSESPDGWRIAANAPAFAFTVYVNDDPLAVLDAFTADTGRPLIPAPWVFGPRRRMSGTSRIPDGGIEWEKMRELNLPLTGIDDAVHFLPALSQVGRETELRAWTTLAHANGIKALAYNNPYVAQNHPNSVADFAFGADAGFFIKDADGDPALVTLISGSPLQVAMIDFTSSAATDWYKSLLQRTVDFGYDGWMHDFGEYVPRTGRLSDGRRGEVLHNPYPRLSAKAARDVLQAAKPDDHLFFVRAGYTGSQAVVPAVWGGDAEVSFDETQGIPSTIRSGLNLALVGVPYWGSDGTGFKCIGNALRDKEVFVRWLELEAVSPIMMEQNACSNPIERRTKWTLWSDVETQDVYRQMASFHTRLMPYFMVLAREANATGVPLMRPPFLYAPKEPKTWALDDTFFLGRALYAAPVLRRGQTTRHVWFPPGKRYVALDDDSVWNSGEADVPAPLTRLPVFLVEGELLPMLDADVQTLAPASAPTVPVVTVQDRADVLDVKVALGPSGEATLTLFDGTKLTARRTASDAGRTGFTDQPDVRTCDRCFNVTVLPSLTRVRVSSSTSVSFDELQFEVSGGPANRRYRWEVLRLP
ncbi:MAG: hypothetical protein JNM17_25510 [Archangium sp.]|nr:hypothetical protein [Archangium sp.]